MTFSIFIASYQIYHANLCMPVHVYYINRKRGIISYNEPTEKPYPK